MVEGARLEIVWAFSCLGGSNPLASASIKSPVLAVFLVRSIVNRATLEETTNLDDFLAGSKAALRAKKTPIWRLQTWLLNRATLEETTNLDDFLAGSKAALRAKKTPIWRLQTWLLNRATLEETTNLDDFLLAFWWLEVDDAVAGDVLDTSGAMLTDEGSLVWVGVAV